MLRFLAVPSHFSRNPDVVDWFRTCLGPVPPRPPIEAELEAHEEAGPWPVERLLLHRSDQEAISALLVRPEGVASPPVVVVHHGFGEGKDVFTLGEHSGYAFARHPGAAGLVEHGLAVFAIDAPGHGPRLAEAPDRAKDSEGWLAAFHHNWDWLARRCIIDGVSLQGLLVHDVRCAIDYLETRHDVDASRLGMYGYSMGGTTCWSAAVVEERIQVAAACGCMLDYETALRVHRDASWHAWVPGLRRHASRQSLIASIAPRPLLTVQGETDFPREGVDSILTAAARSYEEHGCPDHFKACFLPGNHVEAAENPELLDAVGGWMVKYL